MEPFFPGISEAMADGDRLFKDGAQREAEADHDAERPIAW